MNRDCPLVSIIVPCYNHEQYIKQCVLSIINQTYKNIELIVIDDGSSDKSYEILKEMQAVHKFTLARHANIGLSRTLNKGIFQKTSGEFIICLASDDFLLPDRVAKQVDFYLRNTHMGFVFGRAYVVNKRGEVINTLPNNENFHCSFDSLLLECFVPALTVMVKRSVFEDVGGYDEDSYIEDWDLWLRIADRYPFAFLNEHLACYRVHDTNISSNKAKMICAKNYVVSKWIGKPTYLLALRNLLLYEIAYLSVANKRQATKLMIKNVNLITYKSFIRSVMKLLFCYNP